MSHTFAIIIYDPCPECEAPLNPYHEKNGCSIETKKVKKEEDEEEELTNFKYPKRCRKVWNVETQQHEWRQYLGAGQTCVPEKNGCSIETKKVKKVKPVLRIVETLEEWKGVDGCYCQTCWEFCKMGSVEEYKKFMEVFKANIIKKYEAQTK